MPDPEPDEFDWESIQPFVLASPRSLWPNEVQDLTPWVLGKLGELGHQLGLTLKPTGTEVPVGTFRADITAKDGMGRSVIIENQLGPSDHVHFGQVVLYALESSADVIIWLVAVEPRWSGWVGLRPEHQRALERLNEVFAGKIGKHSGPRSFAASRERVTRPMDDMTAAMLCSRFGPPKVGHARLAGGCRRGACSRRGYRREGERCGR